MKRQERITVQRTDMTVDQAQRAYDQIQRAYPNDDVSIQRADKMNVTGASSTSGNGPCIHRVKDIVDRVQGKK